MQQPMMQQPGMMVPTGPPQTIIEEHVNIETKVHIKVAFWNKRSVVSFVRCGMFFSVGGMCFASIMMLIMVAIATSYA